MLLEKQEAQAHLAGTMSASRLESIAYELDGFETNAGVILMGATNRPEILDPPY